METATYTPGYDAAGDLVADPGSGNQYAYDAEGRVCAVSGPSGTVGYIYDAEGNRVARGDIHLVNSQLSCDITQNGFLNTANGVTTPNDETDYILGPGGEQVTEMAQQADGSMQWQRTYAYAGSALIATSDPVSNPAYNPSNPSAAPRTLDMPSFRLTDWLGTLRATTDSSGALQGSCSSLPFGDGLACNGNIPDPHRFTGKERDSESGNDYFGARYYGSSMGRFLSPDPSQLYFADLTNPQSFNLYSYGYNNPLTDIDPSGMDACAYDNGDGTSAIVNAADGGAVNCPGNGFYITTNQQVTGVGYDSNGDLAVAGTADGSLINPDGSAYNPSQSITVNGDDGSSSYIGLQPISSGTQVISTQPTATFSPQGYSRADVCAASALLHKGAATGLDAVGIIPGEGNALKLVQAGAGVVSAGMAVAGPGNNPVTKDVALSGTGLGLTAVDSAKVFEAGTSAAKAVPIAGNVLSGYATYSDLKEMMAYYNDCMAGKN